MRIDQIEAMSGDAGVTAGRLLDAAYRRRLSAASAQGTLFEIDGSSDEGSSDADEAPTDAQKPEPAPVTSDPHQQSLRDVAGRASARERATHAWSPADDLAGTRQ